MKREFEKIIIVFLSTVISSAGNESTYNELCWTATNWEDPRAMERFKRATSRVKFDNHRQPPNQSATQSLSQKARQTRRFSQKCLRTKNLVCESNRCFFSEVHCHSERTFSLRQFVRLFRLGRDSKVTWMTRSETKTHIQRKSSDHTQKITKKQGRLWRFHVIMCIIFAFINIPVGR